MSKPVMGALVKFCNHEGCFIADIWRVGDVNVVVASCAVWPDNLDRRSTPTHHIRDTPIPGYWKPEKGIFVVPASQVKPWPGASKNGKPHQWQTPYRVRK